MFPADYFALDDTARRAMLDALVAAHILSELFDSRAFAPLPVLGVPGWWSANASPDFYDDTSVFRLGCRIR